MVQFNMTTILVSLFALVCVGLVACKYSQEDMEQWEAFKTKYEKRYESVKEEEKRRMIFKSKLDQIREHNILYDRGEVSYQLGVNEFTDKTLHEVPRGLATIREGDIKVVCNNKVHQPRNHLRLPENVDWRKKGVVTEVKNQKKCLTCWAFSATGALEGQHALKSKNLVSLSEQDLTDCDNTNGHCMGGGLPWKAFTYISHHGIDSEESYPYEDKRGKCRFSKKTVAATDKGCHKVPANEEALKEAVATVGPISVCIDSTAPGFDNYKGGIYNSSECYSEPSEVDHAVLVVGYGTTARGEDYWLVKNSWGTTWGEEGYMRLARHFNRCGIANFGSYPLV